MAETVAKNSPIKQKNASIAIKLVIELITLYRGLRLCRRPLYSVKMGCGHGPQPIFILVLEAKVRVSQLGLLN
jgi:hypothetical protein